MAKAKCYKCGAEYDENPKNKDMHPKQCPDGCKKEKTKDSEKIKYGEYQCKKCGKLKADNFSVECPDCYKEEKSNEESKSVISSFLLPMT